MKTRPLLSLMLIAAMASSSWKVCAQAAPSDRPAKLIPLTARYDESNAPLQGRIEVKGKRPVLRARTASRARSFHRGNLAVQPLHSKVTFSASKQQLRKLVAKTATPKYTSSATYGAPRTLVSRAGRNWGFDRGFGAAQQPRPMLAQVEVDRPWLNKDHDCTCQETSKLLKERNYEKAALAYEAYAAKILKTWNKENNDYANALRMQAYSLQQMGRTNEARAIFTKAAQVYATNGGSERDIEWIYDQMSQM